VGKRKRGGGRHVSFTPVSSVKKTHARALFSFNYPPSSRSPSFSTQPLTPFILFLFLLFLYVYFLTYCTFLSICNKFSFCHHHSSLPHFSFPCFFDLPSLLPLSVLPFLSCWLTTPSRSIISSFSCSCDLSKSCVVFHGPILIDFRELVTFCTVFISFSAIFNNYHLSLYICIHTFPNVLEL
jgi:hypothetical protein